jgi:phosphinothricin acetyltransferase
MLAHFRSITGMTILIRDAIESDLPRILDITNDAIANTTAVWNMTPATLATRHAWLIERRARKYPVLVAIDADGTVLGFASFGDFRPFEGYLHTVEHSVYVDNTARRRGIGVALIQALFPRAEELGKHVIIAGIEAGNQISIDLHAKLGFVETGRLPQVGRKFDRWLDLVFMQRILGRNPA